MRSNGIVVHRPDTMQLWQSVACMQGAHELCEWGRSDRFPMAGCDCTCHATAPIHFTVTSREAV
jgi:hypothetical protein